MNQDQFYSAVVIAKNEARTISACILALQKITDDIIIVLDDRSDDETCHIAENLGAKVYRKIWEGYSANKNFGAAKALNDWILCPDADEVLNEELIQSLKNIKPDLRHTYAMKRRTWFGDYPVRYCGWYPDWNIRLYNRKVMQWNGNYVHEKLESTIKLTKLKVDGIVEHYSFTDEGHMKEKFIHYAKMRAEEWKKSGKRPSKIKQWLGPAFRFLRTYIIKRGFLDGKTGYIISKNEYILKQKELEYFLGNL